MESREQGASPLTPRLIVTFYSRHPPQHTTGDNGYTIDYTTRQLKYSSAEQAHYHSLENTRANTLSSGWPTVTA